DPVVAATDELAAAVLAVVAERARKAGDIVVVGREQAADAAGHDLRRVEREAADVAEGAGGAAGEGGAVRVGAVLDEAEAARPPGSAEPRHVVRDEACDVDHDERRAVGTGARERIVDVDAEVVAAHVAEDDAAARELGRVAG